MLLIDDPGLLLRLFGDFSYLAPFTVLLLCGIGLPLPEEVTLIGAGVLLYRGEVEFVPIVTVCSIAILLGDSIPFLLGRRYGVRAMEQPWVRRRLHPRRFRRIRQRFEEHGAWATFTFRFIPGVRLPGYFVSGAMGLSYLRFLVIDALGVLLSVPISIHLGRLFANHMDALKARMRDLHLILAFIAISLFLIVLVRGRGGRRTRPSGREEGAEAEPPPEAPDER